MAATRGPIGIGLEILRDALVPFVESTLANHYNRTGQWFDQVNLNRQNTRKAPLQKDPITQVVYWSPDELLNTITIGEWTVFKNSFKPRSIAPAIRPREDFVVKGWIEEIMETRRRDMHQEPVTSRDTLRFLDTAELLLQAVGAQDGLDKLAKLRTERFQHAITDQFNTRKEYWHNHIKRIIKESDQLLAMDSFQGYKQAFWQALEARVSSAEPFELTYLILREGDPFLRLCLDGIGCDPRVTLLDIQHLERLKKLVDASPHKSNKKLEFLYWQGISPGPILAWRIKDREQLGLGFWVNLEEATDDTPWIVVDQGPLFECLKRHCAEIVARARQRPDSAILR
jgi:hypothetical protein